MTKKMLKLEMVLLYSMIAFVSWWMLFVTAPAAQNATDARSAAVRLDTRSYIFYTGGTYDFLATVTAGHAVPAALSTTVARVQYLKAVGNRQYLYRITALKAGKSNAGVQLNHKCYTMCITVRDGLTVPFTPLLQQPELPTGCEITSLTSVLNHAGFSIGKVELSDRFLPKDSSVKQLNGRLYMPNPAKVFVGDPKKNASFGCFAPVIVSTANHYLASVKSAKEAVNITGTPPGSLYQYLAGGQPVLVWASTSMQESPTATTWYDKDGGEPILWYSGEHCLVLTGCSNSTVTMADPLVGTVQYPRSLFETRYEEFGRQAVLLTEKCK